MSHPIAVQQIPLLVFLPAGTYSVPAFFCAFFPTLSPPTYGLTPLDYHILEIISILFLHFFPNAGFRQDLLFQNTQVYLKPFGLESL